MERHPKTEFTIMIPTLENIPAVRRMHAASWVETYPNEAAGVSEQWVRDRTDAWLTPEGLEKSLNRHREIFTDKNQFYRVAFTPNGDVVGMVHVLVQNGHKHLGALYIDSRYYGRGLAQQLMEQADEWIDGDEVDLEVASYNTRAIRFYEKMGFVVVEGSEHLFGDIVPVVNMCRRAA